MSQRVPSVPYHEGGPEIRARVKIQVSPALRAWGQGGCVEFLGERTTKVECGSA